MADTADILAVLQNKKYTLPEIRKESQPYEAVMDQARALAANTGKLPSPPNTGNTFKDFLLNALNTAPMGFAARAPSPVGTIPQTAPLKSDLGVRHTSGAGIAENANKADPRIQAILDHLSQNNIPLRDVKDNPGGSSYITATNPTTDGPLRIRVPSAEDNHIGRGDTISKFVYRHGQGSYFDLGTAKPESGYGGFNSVRKNQSGQLYGKDPTLGTLFDAVDHITGTRLVPEGRAANLSKNKQQLDTTQSSPSPEQLNLNLKPPPNPNEAAMEQVKPNLYGQPLGHDTIDQVLANMRLDPAMKGIFEGVDRATAARKAGNMEQPQVTVPEMKEQSQSISPIREFKSEPTNFNVSNKNVIDSKMEFQIKNVMDQLDKAFTESGVHNPKPISPETADFHRMINAKVKGNMEQPTLSIDQMNSLSKTIDDVLKDFRPKPRLVE